MKSNERPRPEGNAPMAKAICAPLMSTPTRRLTSGRSYAMPSLAGGGDIRATLDWLRTIPAIRPVEAPVRSWATVTPLSHGTLVSLCPSRHGYSYGGRLQLHGAGVMLPESTGLMRVLFPHAGTPVTLSPQYRLERPNP